MIQRIQTIFLALAALASGGLFGLPFATTQEAEANSGLFADSVYNINDHLVLLITFLLAGIFSLVAIFLFKKRKLQMSLSMMAIFASIIGLAYGLFIFLSDPASEQAGFGLGTVLPELIILFAFLGWRNIKKDEKLVKSMDRLR
jgi:hypothetical protein